MKKIIFLVLLLWVNGREEEKSEDEGTVDPVRNNLGKAGEKAKLPSNLTDANQDGKLDENDFIRGFTGTVIFCFYIFFWIDLMTFNEF